MNEPDTTHRVTHLLQAAAQGQEGAKGELLEFVYEHLRRIARRKMAGERKGHTLQATALVHEAYLRLFDDREACSVKNRAQFYGLAAEAMRRILVEHARKKKSRKRGAGIEHIPIDIVDLSTEDNSDEMLALDEAIRRLEEWDKGLSEVVRLRYFGGLSIEETANVLEISPRSVKRKWTLARAWLHKQLSDEE